MDERLYEALLDLTIHMAQRRFDQRISKRDLSTWDLYEIYEELDLLYNMKRTEWPTLVRLSKKYIVYLLNQEGTDKLFFKSLLQNLKV